MGLSRCVLVLLVCVVLLFDDGSSQTDRRQVKRDKHRRRLQELSRSTSSFSVALYRRLASSSSTDNLIFSPLSVYTALSMAMMGSGGQTKRQLKSVLAQRRGQAVHRTLHAIFASFPTSPESVTLSMANALYYDDTRITLARRFMSLMRQTYEGAAYPFQRPEPEPAINAWVSRHTGGMITDFLQPGDIAPNTALMLLNAVYFQGTWEDIFEERSTRDGNFTTGTGNRVLVPMMSRNGLYSVKDVEALDARVLELPYRDDRFSLFIILPNGQRALRDVEGALSSQVLEEALNTMPGRYRYIVTLPKFTMRTGLTLNDVLKDMGLTMLFESRFADLRRMVHNYTGPNLYVDKVQHEAVIEVNERGTRAAAVTSVVVVPTSLPHSFRADRPFLMVLRDKKAKLNLFIGRLNDPSR